MESAIERVSYDDDAVQVYCLNHPENPMAYDRVTGWWRCGADQCATVVSIHGPRRDPHVDGAIA